MTTKLWPVILAVGLTAGVGVGQEVIDSVDVGSWGQHALTYNSRAGVIYGLSWNGAKFFAIACSTNTLIAEIPLRYPMDIAYDPIDNKAFVSYSYRGEDSVLVIDGNTHSRLGAFPLSGVWSLLYDSVSNRLYANCAYDDEIAVIDCAAESVLCRIPVPGEPVNLTINTRHRKLYCQNDVNMTVSVIDMATNQIITNIYTGSWFFCAAYSEVADKYYCDGLDIAVVCGSGDSLIKQIDLPRGYQTRRMLSVETESILMVATNSGGSDSVWVVDVVRDTMAGAVCVSRQPWVLTRSPRTQLVYCASTVHDIVSAIAGDGSRVLTEITVDEGPQSLAVAPEYGLLYVGHGGFTPMVYVLRDEVGLAEPPCTGSPKPADAATVTGCRFDALARALLVDIAGRPVARLTPGYNDLSDLPPGVYVVVEPGQTRHRKVVKLK